MDRGDKIIWSIVAAWLVGVALGLTFWSAVVYIAFHIIHKLW